jgi:hypothetical protein
MIAYNVSIKYMLAGYIFIFVVLAVYLISLVIRWRNLKREYQVIKDLKRAS